MSNISTFGYYLLIFPCIFFNIIFFAVFSSFDFLRIFYLCLNIKKRSSEFNVRHIQKVLYILIFSPWIKNSLSGYFLKARSVIWVFRRARVYRLPPPQHHPPSPHFCSRRFKNGEAGCCCCWRATLGWM